MPSPAQPSHGHITWWQVSALLCSQARQNFIIEICTDMTCYCGVGNKLHCSAPDNFTLAGMSADPHSSGSCMGHFSSNWIMFCSCGLVTWSQVQCASWPDPGQLGAKCEDTGIEGDKIEGVFILVLCHYCSVCGNFQSHVESKWSYVLFVTDILIPNNPAMPIINLSILEKSLVVHIVENNLSWGHFYKITLTMFTTSSNTSVTSAAENTPAMLVCTLTSSLLMKTRNTPAHCVIIKLQWRVL